MAARWMKCLGLNVVVSLWRWSLSIWLLAGLALYGAAVPNGTIPYSVRSWQTDDGLPQNSVFALAQTPDGYLWIGTREGLARFDGVSFTLVEGKDATELRRGWISALCASRDGSLWIACNGKGLTRLQHGRFSHFGEAEGLPSLQITCLLEDQKGGLWIGSEGGLTRYQAGQFTHFTTKQGLGDNSVRGLCEDSEGTLQIATKRGLSSLSQAGGMATLTFGAGWIGNALRSVYADRQGTLWVGSIEGLHSLRASQRVSFGPQEGLPDRVVNTVYQDHAGQLWIGTYGGLARLVNGQVLRGDNRERVFGDLVYAILEDREENLWVGGRDGLFRLRPSRFTTYTTQEGLTGNNVVSVCEGRTGTLWLGVWGGGVNALEDGRITAYADPGGRGRDAVLSLHEGREGGLWIGLDFDGGLNRLWEGQRRAVPKPDGLLEAAIRVIHQDRRGRLWVGTSRGLSRLEEGKCIAYTPTNGLAGETVLAMCEEETGALWVGTEGGLSRWNGDCFTNFTTREGLSHNTVNALYADGHQTLWIGTKGGGLNWWKAGRFYACTTKEGLFSNEIYEILEDDFGFFWMSCRKGIFRVARKELEELGRGALPRVTCIAFGKADGMASVQCNGVAKPAGWKGRDGRLWFPTIRGVVAVEPRIKTNDKPPPVSIEEVLVDKQSWRKFGRDDLGGGDVSLEALTGPLIVPPGRGELEIHYTALSLQVPEKNRFKYFLEGVDSGWIEAGAERVAHYNNLAPGHYRFRVTGCNNDGVWNETGASLGLVLQPHYWQTWWFKAAIVTVLGLALGLVYRLRVTRLREIERLRIEIAANLHDDVGSRLTKVTMMAEAAEHQSGVNNPLKPQIESISRTTREIVQAMDEIVWTINPKNDSLDNLANYIFQYAQEYFQHTRVRCRLDFPAQLPEHALSTEARHNLFMAVKEALSNVLKHARASEVRMSLTVAEATLVLSIADNGTGFALDQVRTSGNGLGNMKERLERIGGRLLVESPPRGGTRVQMEVTLK